MKAPQLMQADSEPVGLACVSMQEGSSITSAAVECRYQKA